MFTTRCNLRSVNGHRLRDVHVGYNLYNCGLRSFFTSNFQPSCGITFHYKLDLVTISMSSLYMKILGICIWGLILGLALIFRRLSKTYRGFLAVGVTLNFLEADYTIRE